MNMNINQSENQGVTVTPPAKEKIAELLSGADQSQSAVRVFVSGGGCGGMNYGMTFAESVEETDRLIQDNSGCSIAIDPVALAYLEGAEIDFQDDGVSATFVFNNVFKAVGGSGACGGCGGAH
ncbi:MAG: iron-sulfur cluster assembly accessory protein [Candidatus Thioglobus sp.]|jgi:iron-sulfur cluster assembly accessory protein|nr:MAG: iron-sulfur cluster assembly accessory protein [Candidatus Thioglobus sp.]